MILTYKVKHNRDFLIELEKAREIAIFALKTKSRSSKDVKDIGLKSVIANQILKKYSLNKKLKKISSVKLTIPSQSIKFKNNKIKIPCLKMEMDFNKNIEKINQIKLDKKFAYISCAVKEERN
jgi:putative transposase